MVTSIVGCDRVFTQVQEVEALLSMPAMEPSVPTGQEQEPSETSHDTARSSEAFRPRRPPAAPRTKHPSGSNVSFSHDTEGGEEDPSQVTPFL